MRVRRSYWIIESLETTADELSGETVRSLSVDREIIKQLPTSLSANLLYTHVRLSR